MHRRTFLQMSMGSTALVVAGSFAGRDPAWAQPAPGPFGHGVASGDPQHDRVILWTRVTPDAAATPGSGLGAPTPVRWEVALDAAFTSIVASGEVTTSPASDHTVKVDAAGLDPGREYHYRFQALEATSPVGRTRTAPAPTTEVDALRFGVVSCSNWEGGYFSAYRHLAERDDLDAVLHLGDYLYEYGVGVYGPGATLSPPRRHDPTTEMVTLEDYRRRHALYKTDPDLQALHHRYAFVTTIDDHEVADNSWADGALNHTDGAEGDYLERKAAALRAYFEWMPIRPTGGPDGTRIWRRLGFGGLAELFMLDERTHRSQQPEGASEDRFVSSTEPDDPDRTMLGPDQLAFLGDGLESSEARWKLVGNGVMFAPLVLADLPDPASPVNAVLAALGQGSPVVINGDQWDGYRAEQRVVNDLLSAAGGVVVLTGDIHSSWAAEVPADPGSYLAVAGGATTAVEFVTPAVTSDSFGASLEGVVGVPGAGQLAAALPAVVAAAGPWFKYLEPDRHGFGVLEVTPAHVQYDWHYISDRTDPEAGAAFAVAYETLAGTNKLRPAEELGARPDRTTTPTTGAQPTTSTSVPVAAGGRLPATGGGAGFVGPAAVLTAAAGALAAIRRRAEAGER